MSFTVRTDTPEITINAHNTTFWPRLIFSTSFSDSTVDVALSYGGSTFATYSDQSPSYVSAYGNEKILYLALDCDVFWHDLGASGNSFSVSALVTGKQTGEAAYTTFTIKRNALQIQTASSGGQEISSAAAGSSFNVNIFHLYHAGYSVVVRRGSVTFVNGSDHWPNGGSGYCEGDYTSWTVWPQTSWFTTAGVTGSSMTVDIVVTDTLGNTATKTLTITLPELGISVTPTSITVGGTASVSFTNRLNEALTLRVIAYDMSSVAHQLYSATVNANSASVTCPESWFVGVTTYNYMTLRFEVSDSLGRSAYQSNVTLNRSGITLSKQYTTVTVSGTQVITITDPYNRGLNVEVKRNGGSGTTFLTGTNVTGSYSISLTEQAFVDANYTGTSMSILVVFTDSYNRRATITYNLTRTAIGVSVIANTDGSTVYANTGGTFQLQFTNRLSRELTVRFQANGRYLYDITHISSTWAVNQDLATFDCPRTWFDDAGLTTASSMTVTVIVTDAMLRRTTATFEVRSGSDTAPTISASATPVQPSSWPATLASRYVQGYTRVKIAATVTPRTSAAITSVSLSSPQIGSLQMSYNSSTGKYEVTTQAPLTADTSYTITATDQRGMSTTTASATITVLPYANPAITIQSYRRCRQDGTADDTGAYCQMTVLYVFSALSNLNSKDTVVSVSGTGAPSPISRTLPAYTSTQTYLFAADPEHSYVITVTATDLLNTETRSVDLSTAGVIMDFLAGGKGIGLGKVAETANCVEVNPEWKLKAATIELNGVNLGTLLTQIQQRLTNGGL